MLENSTISQHSIFNTSKKIGSAYHSSHMSNPISYRKILNRKFNIARDLTKYTKDLDYKQSERKLLMFSKSAKGKNLNQMRKRAELVTKNESKWTA